MANDYAAGWDGIVEKVRGQCPGCPRNGDKMPVMFGRSAHAGQVDVVIVSQEPGHRLRSLASGDEAASRLASLCGKNDASPAELRDVGPLSKVREIFGRFDPSSSRVYWTHALKCVPLNGDRDINKEWRKAATRCEAHLVDELRHLGAAHLNVVAFGKYPLEMCLHLLDGQDIDQELSISEFMQNSRLPLSFRYKFKDGTVKSIDLFVLTNPSSEVVKIVKSGGKRSVDEIQELEIARLREIVQPKRPK